MARFVKSRRLKKLLRRAPYLRYLPWALEAIWLGLLWSVCSRMTPERASATGRKLLEMIGPHTAKNGHILQNLTTAFPDKPAAEIRKIGRGVWANFGAVLGEIPHIATLLQDNKQYLDITVDQHSRAIIESGKPAIFVVAHLANWELVAAVIVKLGVPLSAIFSAFGNPLLDPMLQRRREAQGYRLITKQAALRSMFKELNNGRSVGLLPDQRVDSGKSVPFLGVDAPTTISPARVAIRCGCAIIPVRMERLSGCRFLATFYPPIRTGERTGDEYETALQITAEINELFTSWIRERPEQWLCAKRRWPKPASAKRNYIR